MWFSLRMMRIPWADHVTNEDVLRKAKAHRYLGKNNPGKADEIYWALHRKRRRERLGNLTLTGHTAALLSENEAAGVGDFGIGI